MPQTVLANNANNANASNDTTKTAFVQTVPEMLNAIPKIPKNASGLMDCARHEITKLENLSDPTDGDNEAWDDGFMMCDVQIIETKLQVWHELFPRVRPYFALKCNPDPNVAAVLANYRKSPRDTETHAGYDCASIPEVELAKHCSPNQDVSLKQVVYANPQRAEQALIRALELGVRVWTFDGTEELHKITKALKQMKQNNGADVQPPDLLLRILVPDAHSTVPLGEKFGAPPNQIEPLTETACSLLLNIIGVSFHCGSGCHDPEAYATALGLAKQAMTVIDTVQKRNSPNPDDYKPCWVMDMGGGYPGYDGLGGDKGRFSGIPTIATSKSTSGVDDDNNNDDDNGGEDDPSIETASAIADKVVPLLDKLFPSDHFQLLAEPGRYFVEAAFALVSRIYKVHIDENDSGRRNYYIAHGVQGVFKDVLLCDASFVPTALFDDADDINNDHDNLIPSTIRGPSGIEDVVCGNCMLPSLEIGDWLVFDRMGAYTLSIAARSGRPAMRYVRGAGRKSPASN